MDLIKRHLSSLTDFSGRENRQPFWLWILCVYIAQMILGIIVSIPLTARMMGAMQPMMGQDEAYLNAHPEVVSRMMMEAMGPFFRDVIIFSAVAGVIYIVLIAAAVVRRLHDGNRSGWWAVPPLAIQIVMLSVYAVLIPRFMALMGSIGPETSPEQINAAMSGIFPWFGMVALIGFFGFIFGVVLIVMLVLRGTVGPNRYGEDLLPPPVPYVPQPAQIAPAPPAFSRPAPATVVRDTPPDA